MGYLQLQNFLHLVTQRLQGTQTAAEEDQTAPKMLFGLTPSDHHQPAFLLHSAHVAAVWTAALSRSQTEAEQVGKHSTTT